MPGLLLSTGYEDISHEINYFACLVGHHPVPPLWAPHITLIFIYIYDCTSIYICMYTSVYMSCLYVYVCIQVYVCMYVCTYACI